MHALEHKTWALVDFPPSEPVVGCGWVYAVKVHMDGTLHGWQPTWQPKAILIWLGLF